jgi:hypothetical protein
MNAIVYMLQVSACTAIFYCFYYLLLSRLTFFTINRWYLLTTLTVSFIIPLLTITVHDHAPVVVQQVMSINRSQVFTGSVTTKIISDLPVQHVYNWLDLLKLIYLLTAVVLFVKLIATLIAFFRNINKGSRNEIGGVSVISGNKTLNNGSFFNYIFLSDDDLSADDVQQIIEHEMLHVKLYHSVDRIIVKVAQIVLWFNPFIYGYARAIEENHEFEVDKKVGRSANKNRYADMLLHLSIANQGTLYNTFSKVPLKRRITMLFTKPTNHMKKIIYLLILPVVMISCLAFARLKDDAQKDHYSVIEGVEDLGSNPTVYIDGKLYNTDILYRISGVCIASSKVIKDVAPVKTGGTEVIATVEIKTTKGEIIYLTPAERKSLVEERSIPKTQFYTRLHITDHDGNRMDKIIVKFSNRSETSNIAPGDKAGFVVDGTFYTEDQFKNFTDKKIKSLNGENAISPAKAGEYPGGVVTIFNFKTGKTATDTTHFNKPKNVVIKPAVIKNETITPTADDWKSARDKVTQNAGAPFFSRFHFTSVDGKRYDIAMFKLTANNLVGSTLGVNDNVGIWIDGKFYNEDAIKKLTPEKIATLTVDNNPMDPSKFEKIDNGGHNSLPITLKTKTNPDRVALDTTGHK